MLNKTKIFILISYVICLVLLASAFIVGKKFNIPFEKITGDPSLTFKAHPFTGIISNIGALLWCTTVSICLFAGLVLRKLGSKNESNFLLFSGFFSFILLIDDFFMFHDYIFYSFKSFTIRQPFVYAVYALLLLFSGVKFYKIVFKSKFYLLFIAAFFLGLSVLTDLIFPSEGLQYFIEDALKFIGIVSWMLFFTVTSFDLLSQFRNLKAIN